MNETQKLLQDYFKMTGQTSQELLAGAETIGINAILEMLPRCLEKRTKIVWTPKEGMPGEMGLMDYKFESIDS